MHPQSRTVIREATKRILAAQMHTIADAHGNLSATARQLSRHYLVRVDTIQANWRRWRLEIQRPRLP